MQTTKPATGRSVRAANMGFDDYKKLTPAMIKQAVGNDPQRVKEAVNILNTSGKKAALEWLKEQYGSGIIDELARIPTVRAAATKMSLDEYKKLVTKKIGAAFVREQYELVVEYFADGKSVDQLKADWKKSHGREDPYATMSNRTVKAGRDEFIAKFESWAGTKLRSGRVSLKGYPVDIKDQDPEDSVPTGIYVEAVDGDAARGLLAELKRGPFKGSQMSGKKGVLITMSNTPVRAAAKNAQVEMMKRQLSSSISGGEIDAAVDDIISGEQKPLAAAQNLLRDTPFARDANAVTKLANAFEAVKRSSAQASNRPTVRATMQTKGELELQISPRIGDGDKLLNELARKFNDYGLDGDWIKDEDEDTNKPGLIGIVATGADNEVLKKILAVVKAHGAKAKSPVWKASNRPAVRPTVRASRPTQRTRAYDFSFNSDLDRELFLTEVEAARFPSGTTPPKLEVWNASATVWTADPKVVAAVQKIARGYYGVKMSNAPTVSAAGTASREDIKRVFSKVYDVEYFKAKGATVREIKDALRGRVPQDQRKFVTLMQQLKLKSGWSKGANAWVVYDEVEGQGASVQAGRGSPKLSWSNKFTFMNAANAKKFKKMIEDLGVTPKWDGKNTVTVPAPNDAELKVARGYARQVEPEIKMSRAPTIKAARSVPVEIGGKTYEIPEAQFLAHGRIACSKKHGGKPMAWGMMTSPKNTGPMTFRAKFGCDKPAITCDVDYSVPTSGAIGPRVTEVGPATKAEWAQSISAARVLKRPKQATPQATPQATLGGLEGQPPEPCSIDLTLPSEQHARRFAANAMMKLGGKISCEGARVKYQYPAEHGAAVMALATSAHKVTSGVAAGTGSHQYDMQKIKSLLKKLVGRDVVPTPSWNVALKKAQAKGMTHEQAAEMLAGASATSASLTKLGTVAASRFRVRASGSGDFPTYLKAQGFQDKGILPSNGLSTWTWKEGGAYITVQFKPEDPKGWWRSSNSLGGGREEYGFNKLKESVESLKVTTTSKNKPRQLYPD